MGGKEAGQQARACAHFGQLCAPRLRPIESMEHEMERAAKSDGVGAAILPEEKATPVDPAVELGFSSTPSPTP